jgi:hypothetical protein
MQALPPRTGPLTDWLRTEARASFELPRGDVGDQVPLQWLPEEAVADSRLELAVANLLREGDPVVSDRLLDVSTNAAMRRGVVAALADAATTLRAVEVTPDWTLLGRAVRALRVLDGVLPLPDATLRTLHDIDARKDGWPTSVAIGLAAAPARFTDLLAPTLTRCSPEDAKELAWVFLANASEDGIRTALRHTASHSPTSDKDRFATAIKRELGAQDDARAQMVNMGIALPPAESGASRWARYASDLGVNP